MVKKLRCPTDRGGSESRYRFVVRNNSNEAITKNYANDRNKK
jgi:hypothetical protein